MAKHIVNKIAKFIGITDSEGNPVHDWHDEFIDTVGMLSIYEEQHVTPARYFLYFYPNEPNMEKQRYFNSLSGKLTDSEGMIVLEENNKYIFVVGDFVSEEDKFVLWANVFLR